MPVPHASNPSPHIHEVLNRQPMRRHGAAQLSHQPIDLQIDLRYRGDFPPGRTGQRPEREQPGRRLPGAVDDGAIASFEADAQRVRR